MHDQTSFNRLKDEKSQYLKLHEKNPIHWWPFGPEALQYAKDQDKPIFLSIGYSSCHMCHVMKHESFENEEIAKILNENFVSIKVDREEFPDLDNYYQIACQLYSRSGGWPLSAFLFPDMKPYFVGTYYPPETVNNYTGFKELILELARVYKEDNEQAKKNADEVTQSIEKGLIPKDRVEYHGHFPAPGAIMEAIKQFQDDQNGGYGDAPKFPNFPFYEWALEQMLEGMIEKSYGEHIIKSLENMLLGGIFDHARGGIHRYSTDKKWLTPHFEKMLYDQAGLLRVLAKLSAIYPSPLVFDNLIQTLDYLELEMFSEDKYFFSAQDSESEGVEGLYFTFTEEEFVESLANDDTNSEQLNKNIEKIKEWFNVTKNGNFVANLNIISLNPDMKEDIFTSESWEQIRSVRKALANSRKNRMPPSTDSKGIASWNFMLGYSLIDVIQYCRIDVIRQQASNLFNQCLEGLYKTFLVSKDSPEFKIRHTTTLEATLPYLEDYISLAKLQLRSYEISSNPVFKQNFLEAIQFIHREFIDGDAVLTRAKSTNEHQIYPNQRVSSQDNSFCSPASTLIEITRRAAVLFQNSELLDPIEKVREELTHELLKNPLNAGEGLRALTYPDEAYRVVTVPKTWATQPKFASFIPYFLTRFILDYHAEENDEWKISNINECELQGEGLDNFIETLSPSNKEEEEKSN